ncbi:MAG: type IV pilus assembly protein PilM [Epsilonproteobacteria bacterium]|nr:type IV pilus assembly protein PilM [Campylobacterota bacterium]
MKRQMVGLDIGSYSIKVAKLKHTKSDIIVTKLAIETYSDDLDYENLNAKSIAEFIKKLFKKNKIKDKTVCVSLHGNDVIVKNISLPAVDMSELKQAVIWEAEQYIPYNINDVNIGFQLLPSDDNEKVNVLIAAAKKETVEKRKEIIREAGLNAEIIDIDSLAIANCFEQNYDDDAKGLIYLLDIGKSYTKLNIVDNSITLFARDMPIGTTELINKISKRLNIGISKAEHLVQNFDINKQETENYPEIKNMFDESYETIVAAATSSIQFFLKNNESEYTASQQIPIYISGGGALISGLQPYFEEKLATDVMVMNPFKAILVDPSGVSIRSIKGKEAIYSTSIGLALRNIF